MKGPLDLFSQHITSCEVVQALGFSHDVLHDFHSFFLPYLKSYKASNRSLQGAFVNLIEPH